MERYTKEESEFLKKEVERLSKKYPKLDIFNRQNNPYLQYKDTCYKTKEYQKIQTKKVWWQDHILQLLQDKNTYKIILFKDRDIKENNDMILFILISLYFEIPIAYEFHHMYHKLKELDKEYLTKRNKAMAHLKNVRQEIENKYSLEMYSKKENFLFSRELDSKTGIRNLCMRYIVLCMQIVGIYKANRKTYIFIYNFLYRVLPKEYEEEMLNLSIDDINKYIKDIDINNNEQSYKYTFCGLQEFDEHPKILKKIIKLIFGKMSYDKFIDFCKKWGY